MSTSPKRKSENPDTQEDVETKKPRLGLDDHTNRSTSLDDESSDEPRPADSLIDHAAAIDYWSGIDAIVSGVLGGYPQLSRIDLQSSRNFLAKLRRRSKHFPPGRKLRRAVDCGAGIGRIAEGMLVKAAETVDLVEPVKKLTDAIRAEGIGEVFNVGLQDWFPARRGGGQDEGSDGGRVYDLIWNQWCCSQLTDKQLEEYFARLPPALSEGGWIIVKENTSRSAEDIFDDVDSSVTRTEAHFQEIFARAGLKVVGMELQKGFPKNLYPVLTWALQPKAR